jgi:hypothetical protein
MIECAVQLFKRTNKTVLTGSDHFRRVWAMTGAIAGRNTGQAPSPTRSGIPFAGG